MRTCKRIISLIVFLTVLLTNLLGPVPNVSYAQAPETLNPDALVLVNSNSPNYGDFQHFIQPYLDHFGVPYAVLDIASTPVSDDIESHSLIIIGHRQLDVNHTYLDATENSAIITAVQAGTGLVNFDNYLSSDHTTSLYSFVDTIFNFDYNSDTSGDGVTFNVAGEHYITQRHTLGESLDTETMTLAGVSLPANVTQLVSSGTQPFLTVTAYPSDGTGGRAVQWGSYDWMSHSVLGPLMGLDDLVWRSLVWAARKPFVMQGMPPFVTMRMDDTIGPLNWIHIANEVGFKPWAGIFINQFSDTEAADLKSLVDSGNATASIHAFDTSDFFYFDHYAGTNFSNDQIAANFATGTKWFSDHQIRISKYLVPHYYEVGSNALNGLHEWGVEFLGTMMDPGQLEASAPWMKAAPFRQYEDGSAYDRNHNIYYADTFPTDNRFFNCITEFRNADPTTHYEWDPNPNDVPNSIKYGTKWLTDALDGMDLATLFSHEYMVSDVNDASMRTIMQGIAQNIAPYSPIYVTMDDACQYARAIQNSNISASGYNPSLNRLTVNFSGQTDVATKFYVFTTQSGEIQQALVDVPVLTGSGQVEYTLPGALDHIIVLPNPASVVAGVTQQFTALGYDAENNPIPNLNFTWSAFSSAGTINRSGLFTAGTIPGTYSNAVSASFGGITGHATVEVTQTVIDHFSIEPISSPQYKDVAFPITIRARDASNNPVVTYTGSAQLSDTTTTITPMVTDAFTNGVWTGSITIHQTGAGIAITAQDGSVKGVSSTFDVNNLRQCPCSVWEGGGTPINPDVSDNRPIEVGFKFQSDVSGHVLGVRFYKGAGNTGTHTGHLWSKDGTLLAEAQFSEESASGWQQVLFANPVAIDANTTYIASYFSADGHFADSPDYFTTQVTNAPLHALADAEDGPNGVFRYDASGFPTQTWTGHAPNYWVDVLFDTVPAREYMIWNGDEAPANPAASDPGHTIEVGVKFRASSNGEIRGLRYYKGSGVTGVHTGHLWSATGSLLGTVDFTAETDQGWQEARFSTPIPIYANTTYVASYYSPNGYFAITSNFFTGAVSSPPLKALANGEDGPNGVFNYDSSNFPSTSGNGSNYWVDVIFRPGAVPDITPPSVIAVSPAASASGVNVTSQVTAVFSEALDPSTVNIGIFELRDGANNLVPASVSYNASSRMAVLVPQSSLTYSTTYTARIKGGAGGVTDAAGNPLAEDYTWTFTTSAPPPPPPDEGPGGPILVIGSAVNPFGRYYAEILRNEGLNEFYATDITSVTAQMLTGYDVVILGEMSLDAAQVTMFHDWVLAGGNLIAMRPDKQLAGLLGLTDAGSTLSNEYLRIDTAHDPGKGLTGETIQFHGTADRYTANSGTAVLATLYADANTTTINPAVTLVSVGSNGGQAAAFTYDLARSVVYTRQGNPAWVGQDRDANDDPQKLVRSDDLFYGNAPNDPQPDWIDFNKIQIPQADEQQRLLANMILQMNADRMPLPRFWYFPRGEKAVIVMTGDDHNASGTAGRFDIYKSLSPAGCSVDDWECIRGTSYIFVGNTMTNAQAAAYSAEGFEVALHFDTGCSGFTPSSLETIISSQLNTFLAKYASIPPIVTQRTHCIAFSDWDSQPIVSAAHGIRMDTNYYYWPPAWTQDRAGLFTGSGMIMRFARQDGSIIDSYQAVTQMTDESGMSYPQTVNVLLDNATGPLGYYGAFVTNMHTDNAVHAGSEAIINSALARGVPVVSAKQMLTWLDGRNGSAYKELAWDHANLTFQITVGAGANGLQGMLPITSGQTTLSSITRDGNPVRYTTGTIKGVSYALFNATAGSYTAAYSVDTSGPEISGVSATPDENNGVHIAWTTDEPATSQVDFGTDPAILNQKASEPDLVITHSLTLSNLNPNTTYYYRITSVDQASNTTTYPMPGEEALSFTTPPAVLRDTTVADFTAGASGSCSIVETNNGEVILPAQIDAEFSGSSLSEDWSVANIWSSGGGAVLDNGWVSLDAAMIASNASYPVGRSLEFVATISNKNTSQNEHIGLATDLSSAPWAIFSTGAPGGTTLKARTWGSSQQETDLGSAYLGSPHRYRIDWLADRVDYYIDGALVASHTVTFANGTQLRPVASDYSIDTAQLAVDWMRLSPYNSLCTYTSRVMDAGEPVNWNVISWTSQIPAGTNLSLRFRIGNSPSLGSADWITVNGGSPQVLSGNSRYIQYQAELSSGTAAQTPVLEEVTFTYTIGKDTTAPSITNLSAIPTGTSSAVISWNTNEPADSLIEYGTAPNALVSRASSTSLVVSHEITLTGLNAETTYYYKVTSKDLANNSTTFPASGESPSSFTTPAEIHTLVNTTTADFTAGTGECIVDSTIGDGALRLPATIDEEFNGAALPSGWSGYPWTGGNWTVAGGSLTVDGASARNDTLFNPGITLEFVATFRAEAYQHVGFGGGNITFNQAPIAMFSTRINTNTLYTSLLINGVFTDEAIPDSSSLLGSPHRYRIDWKANGFDFYVDGSLVSSRTNVITEQMRVAASDYTNGGYNLTVDGMRLTPYLSPCSFTSQTLDAGTPVVWRALARTGSLPDGTGITLETRSGSTSTPDDTSWSTWAPIADDGGINSPGNRYIQYRAVLTSNNGVSTPTIEEIAISYTLPHNPPSTAIALQEGWNLVSINLHPADTRPEAVLASIVGKYDLVYAWDASGSHSESGNWLKFDNIPLSPDTLTSLDERMGFWIHMTAVGTLEVTGSIPATSDIQLHTTAGGWNLVGYPTGVNGLLPDIIRDHGLGADFSMVYTYQPLDTTNPWKLFDQTGPEYANDLTELAPGWGYWIKISADHTWQVSYNVNAMNHQ